MQEAIIKRISWDRIGEEYKEAGKVLLEKGRVSTNGEVLTLWILSNLIIPYENLKVIEKDIISEVPSLKEVVFKISYEEIILPPSKIASLYLPYIVDEINCEGNMLGKFIYFEDLQTEEILLEGGKKEELRLDIPVLGENIRDSLEKDNKKIFELVYMERFGIKVKVNFFHHEKAYEKTKDETRAKIFEELKAAEERQKKASKKRKNPWEVKDVFGKNIRGEAINISEIDLEHKKAIVSGRLFKKDVRTIKNNRKLVNLLISDKSSSICCRLFLTEEKWEDLDLKLEKDDYIKVEGEPEWDTFENTLILKTKAIMRENPVLREDLSDEKRIELHCHTKMSENDGLNDIKDLLFTVSSWGQEGVAITDHGVVQAFPEAFQLLQKHKDELDLKIIYGMEGYLYDDSQGKEGGGLSRENSYHIVLLAMNQKGLRNLYELVSESHLNHLYYKRPRIPKSFLKEKREGLLLGSACEAGEVFTALTKNKSDEELKEIASFYDYLEVMPLINNKFMIEKGMVESEEDLKSFNFKLVKLGEDLDIPVVATTDSHYKEPEDAVYRTIIQAGQGYKDAEDNKGLYLRTTEEMLEEFSYMGQEKAYELVVTNTRKIFEKIEDIQPIPKGKFPPKIEDADEILTKSCYDKAQSIYGKPLPESIKARLDKELESITGNGYAVMYVSAKMLVEKSLEDGYLVGSRGSVGSSFAATMAGITEVNPLYPHYVCPKCKYLEWGDIEKYDCGVDMPEKVCPGCGGNMERMGFSIPFETFLGFDGDKEPDIDLNFAGEYQATAHKYVEEIFGKENVFKAGTIGTIQDRTAYGYVKKYHEEKGKSVNKWEVERLVAGCTRIRRTTGQHPGGIIIVPRGNNIHEFCPVQRPANDNSTDIVTTHFDYHSLEKNLLKLDLLGHDVPSLLRHLQDLTGVNPLSLPLNDTKVNALFTSTDVLNIKEKKYEFSHGTYGIPEFGTEFVRRMLEDTSPSSFADLVRISGFSHGTDVWNNNARELIKSGVATLKDAISTRDDIMNYLLLKGVSNKDAFNIMESVRKGKGLTEKEEKLMREKGVKDWYIESCKKIKYMFPRAHAVAYVMMSYRIAYYKVYYPEAFYAAFFTAKKDDFDSAKVDKKAIDIFREIKNLEGKGKTLTDKEKNEVILMEVMYEMFSRGFAFLHPRFGISDPLKFTLEDKGIRLPLSAVAGLGENAAKIIAAEYSLKPYASIDDLRERGRANNTAIDSLRFHGTLGDMPESDQMTIFEI